MANTKVKAEQLEAAQTNITSLGTLSALTISGDLTVDTSTLKVDSSNNRVGIGTTSPAYKLQVEDTTATNTSNYISVVSGNAANAGIAFGDSDADLVGGILYNHSDNALRFFKSGFSEAARIDSNGMFKVGKDSGTDYNIGSAVQNSAIHLANSTSGDSNNIGLVLTTEANGEVYLTAVQNAANSAADFRIGLRNGGSRADQLIVKADGKIQIGTETANGHVSIDPADGVADEAYALFVRNNEATDGRNYGLTVRAGSTSADESFSVRDHANASTYFKVQGDGKVGIGTTSPGNFLHVKGTGETQVYIDAATNNNSGVRFLENGTNKWTIGNDNTNDGFFFYDFTASAERMRIDSSGYVQFGATIATHIGTNQVFINRGVNAAAATSGTTQTGGALRLRGGNNAVLDMGMNSTDTWIQATDRANLANGYNLALNPNGGGVSIGQANAGTSRLYTYSNTDAIFTGYFLNDHSGGLGVAIRSDSNSMMYFYNGGTFMGRIYHNGTTMLYADQSDYRLKENVQTMTGSIDRIKKLNPVTFDWKADGKASEGFLAHEVQDVVPTAVAGEKDAKITELGEGIQIMDYGKVTPVLVAALQEAIARIEALETKVKELEAK